CDDSTGPSPRSTTSDSATSPSANRHPHSPAARRSGCGSRPSYVAGTTPRCSCSTNPRSDCTPRDVATLIGVLDRLVDAGATVIVRSEEHTSELQSRENLVCRLLLAKKNW